jgi:hypothetical protein
MEYVNVVLKKVKDDSDKLVRELARKIDREVEKRRLPPAVPPSSFLKRFKLNTQRIWVRQHRSQSELLCGNPREGLETAMSFHPCTRKMENPKPRRMRKQVYKSQLFRVANSSMCSWVGHKGLEKGWGAAEGQPC